MESTQKMLISYKDEMSKKDLIETILMIVNNILDYTSSVEVQTPSVFDRNYFLQECDSDKLSTSSSSNDENLNFNIIQKEKNFSLYDYFYYWIEKLEFNENLLLLTLMNFDKLLAKQFILSNDNVKNVLFTCMVITQKTFEDEIFNDKDYAKILEVPTDVLIEMELEFMELIDFSLYISEEKFKNYKQKMYNLWKNKFSFLTFS